MNVHNIISSVAYNMLEVTKDNILFDVRTTVEWQESGIPKLEQDKVILLSWRLLPNMALNTEFQGRFTKQIIDKKHNIFFICRAGVRSLEAAKFASTLGYESCYNIIDGFEGNSYGIGWKQSNLPWQI